MRLFLVRHGQTEWNTTGRAQGHTDIPLDQVGKAQALAVAKRFTPGEVDLVWTSDLMRSKHTAEAIAKALKVPLEERTDLRERCFGEWEGDGYEDVGHRLDFKAKAEGVSRLHVRAPGGESFLDVWDRLDPVLEALNAETRSLAVVSHGGTCSVLLARLMRGTLETSRSFRFPNTAVTELQRRPDGMFTLVRFGDVTHLAS